MRNLFESRLPRISAPTRFGELLNGEHFVPVDGALRDKPFVKVDCRNASNNSGERLRPRHDYAVILVAAN